MTRILKKTDNWPIDLLAYQQRHLHRTPSAWSWGSKKTFSHKIQDLTCSISANYKLQTKKKDCYIKSNPKFKFINVTSMK